MNVTHSASRAVLNFFKDIHVFLVPRAPRCHGVFKVGSCIFGALCPGLAGQERAIIDWTEHFGAFENAEANAGAIESNASLVISFFVGIISCFAFW